MISTTIKYAPFVVCGLLLACFFGLQYADRSSQADSVLTTASGKSLPDVPDFNRDIRPILSDHCFLCHGPSATTRKAELRLDSRDAALAKGVIKPGDAANSPLYQRVSSHHPDKRMPPDELNKPLNPVQIELMRRWINAGAEYKPHWAFVRVERPVPPPTDSDWPINDIDRFVLARMQAKGLQPSPRADRATLIRRVALDLTGLPPTVEQREQYLIDTSPDAYEKMVDRYLASPRYGEHMARYWLDAARYGDTHGLHIDNYREIWPYRDWVIRAFNDNMPFDRFTIEQLAGDLLENPTLDQLIATGFNRCHVTTNEGGAIVEEVYVRNVVDRVETFGTVFMGLTVGCATCHDHKYDPISQAEFYQLFAFFNNLDGKAMDGNRKEHAPYIKVPLPEDRKKLDAIKQKIVAALDEQTRHVQSTRKDYEAWVKRTGSDPEAIAALEPAYEALVLHLPLDEAESGQVTNAVNQSTAGKLEGKAERIDGRFGRAIDFKADGVVNLGDRADFERNQSFSYGAWVKTPGNASGGLIARINGANHQRGFDVSLANRRVLVRLISKWPDNALKVTSRHDVLKPNTWHHVLVTYNGSSKAEGITLYVDGKPQSMRINNNKLDQSIRADVPLQLGRRSTGGQLVNVAVDDVRIYGKALSAAEVAGIYHGASLAPIFRKAPDKRTDADRKVLGEYYRTQKDPVYRKLVEKLDQLRAEEKAINDRAPITLIFRERAKPRDAFFLERGRYDQKKQKVERRVPGFLPKMAENERHDRLGLARWLVSRDHPLTSRVTVNRFWQQLFGRGLVKTSEDFGLQGAWPSHPQLLDWLAVEFMENNWNVKRLMRMIVTSATYRQSSRLTPEHMKKDPENILLARGPRYRLDAEQIRDQALAVSGLLVQKLGGPPVKPYQPQGLWKAVAYPTSNTAHFKQDHGEALYRRSIYDFWKRTSPPPNLMAFDAPMRDACTVRRERTNTPTQALVLMNDVQFVEAARVFAAHLACEKVENDEQRIERAYDRALGREPSAQEIAALLELYRTQHEHYEQNPEDAGRLAGVGEYKIDAQVEPAELAAWTTVTSVIMNLDEFMTKE